MSEREDDRGGDAKGVMVDGDSKKTNGWKSLKEMKEYLRSEFEKKAEYWQKQGGETYLHFAAYLGDVDATKKLIEDKAEVNAVDERKETALHRAAQEGHAEVAKVLIQNGADLNAVDKCNVTALHLAALNGHADIAKVLIQNGADVNAVHGGKMTALHFAAWHGHVAVAKVLIQKGVDVNAVSKDKSTALRFAVIYGLIPCTLQLLCCGAEIDEQAIKVDKTGLLRPIESRLKMLRDGNRMGTSLMSDEERRFLWNLGFILIVKHPAIAFGTYQRIRSFVTFHGIFMGPGYGLGEESITLGWESS
tara:strand:- start:447 stop:1361 length:915 start_codon:yes stop_codon:yes gene_type:complete